MEILDNTKNPEKTSDVLEMFGKQYKGCDSCQESGSNLKSKRHYVYMKKMSDGNTNIIKEK